MSEALTPSRLLILRRTQGAEPPPPTVGHLPDAYCQDVETRAFLKFVQINGGIPILTVGGLAVLADAGRAVDPSPSRRVLPL